ncbi:heterokaryon incompatibility protein-domain-containing protein [Colletotrichum cereale]|nr:heterokaryon incompatibility protein-domain-containing protein [Colletotrichum cereale]
MNVVLPTKGQICERCLCIDFVSACRALAAGKMEPRGILLDDDARRFVIAMYKTTCTLCNLLSNATPNLSSLTSESKAYDGVEQEFELRAFSYLQNSIGVWHATPGVQDSLMVLVTFKNRVIFDETFFNRHGYGGRPYVVCLCPDGRPGLLKPQEIPKLFDHGKARLWIDNCKEDHGPRCNEPVSSAAIPGMKLIDCNTLQIEPARHGMQWIALSYVWSPQLARFSDHVDHQLPSVLSASVKDAVALTNLLGYQYLWVDKYCIDQSDMSELGDQINKMHLIYSNAEATIVAAADPDETCGLPGVGSTERFKQDVAHVEGTAIINMGPHPAVYVEKESRWWKRGWTFQEGLISRRRITFTRTQAFFECNTASWTEALGGVEFVKDRQSLDWTKWKNGTFLLSHYMGQPESQAATEATWHGGNELLETPAVDSRITRSLVDFFRLVQQYTTRNLTYDSDSLNAITGMLRILARRKPSVLHLSGLPYLSLPEQVVPIHTQLFTALSWYHKSGMVARRRPDFPSWTWAGWAGAIRWMCYPYISSLTALSPIMRAVELEYVSESSNFLRTDFEQWLDDMPESPIALRFEAQSVSHSLFCKGRIPSQWSELTIGNQRLLGGIRTPTETPVEFLDLLKGGVWGCLLVGTYRPQPMFAPQTYLIVVEWVCGATATRVGALLFEGKEGVDEDIVRFYDKHDLPWTRVRLI